jgi:DNA polymerase I-like protein with 3'-5' exonuclease and polymerase domains
MKKNKKQEKNNKLLVEDLWSLLPAHIREPSPSLFLSDNYVVLDFETTTLDKGSPHNPDNSIVCVCWRLGPDHPMASIGTSYKTVGNEFGMMELVDHIHMADFFVAHNTKFELGWLERCGIPLETMVAYCTKVGEKVLAGNRHWPLSLDDIARRYKFGHKDPMGKLVKLGLSTLSIPLHWLVAYCHKDVELTEKIFLEQRKSLNSLGLLPITWTRNILTPVLYDIEKYGLNLDPERVAVIYQNFKGQEEVLEAAWNEFSGSVNVNSPKQKVEYLYTTLGIPHPLDEMGEVMLTDTGNISTDADAMDALKPKTKKAKQAVAMLRELASVKQALSKYLTKLNQAATEGDGIVYGSFSQTNTQTHRLSSTGRDQKIQLQNFQRKFRPCVRPRTEGWSIGDGDASGIEFRTAVDLAKDPAGLEDVRNGVDIHELTASTIFAKKWNPELGSKEGGNADLRQAAKPDTFKPLYGGSSGTPAQRKYYKAFRERYSATYDMQVAWTHEVLRTKVLVHPATGFRFYWPKCKMSGKSGYIKYTTNIFDYPVQNMATAEMSPTATVYLWHLMKAAKMLSFLINIVHDSAVGEIHPAEKEQWKYLLEECFNVIIVWYLKEVFDYDWECPLESETKFGHHWTDNGDDYMAQWEEAA